MGRQGFDNRLDPAVKRPNHFGLWIGSIQQLQNPNDFIRVVFHGDREKGQEELMPSIVEKLKECYDPEISVDIYNLGLIYDVKVTEDGYVHVLMSLTSAFCPAADIIPQDVKVKVESIPNLKCKVKITMQPQWGREMINPEIRDLMGL